MSDRNADAPARAPGRVPGHGDHKHYTCGCGKVFHDEQELKDHARRLNHRVA